MKFWNYINPNVFMFYRRMAPVTVLGTRLLGGAVFQPSTAPELLRRPSAWLRGYFDRATKAEPQTRTEWLAFERMRAALSMVWLPREVRDDPVLIEDLLA